MIERLRRDLGTLESYATLLGILIGAGIFRVTSAAWALTGPSVILGYLVLAPAVLATSVAYAVFLSTPLGREPGGEYTHISRTLGGRRLAFVGCWLKMVAYVGALAYLAHAFADYLMPLAGASLPAGTSRLALALASLAAFYLVHVFGVRWFGRLQVAMCAVLGLSLVVLVLPGMLAVRPSHYAPFFTGGVSGFAACLPPLFFAYAGFESLAQTAGEVRDSQRRLPRVFLWGILATTGIFLSMSVVTFGVLPGQALAGSTAPMAEVAAVYLPAGGAALVTLGALMALATSLNATFLVPSRLALMLAEDRLLPAWLGRIWGRTGTPVIGLTLTLAAAVLLLASGQMALALNIAVLALVALYLLHSVALLLLPRRNPALWRQVRSPIPRSWQVAAAVISAASMAGLMAVQAAQDLGVLGRTSLWERVSGLSLTSLELAVGWSLVGAGLYALGQRERRRRGA